MKNTIKRIVEIFKPDFLSKQLKEKDNKETWKFWFFWNSVFAFGYSIAIGLVLFSMILGFMKFLDFSYGDAKIIVENGKLSTEGLREPIFQESKDKSSVLVVDTKAEKYESGVLDGYQEGVYVGSEKLIYKKNAIDRSEYTYSQMKENFSYTEKQLSSLFAASRAKIILFLIAVLFIVFWFIYAIARLLTAAIMALGMLAVAGIMKIETIDFKKAYFASLNLYMIPLIAGMIVPFFGIGIPFQSLIIMLVLFYLNLNYLKKNEDSEIDAAPKNENEDVI